MMHEVHWQIVNNGQCSANQQITRNWHDIQIGKSSFVIVYKDTKGMIPWYLVGENNSFISYIFLLL